MTGDMTTRFYPGVGKWLAYHFAASGVALLASLAVFEGFLAIANAGGSQSTASEATITVVQPVEDGQSVEPVHTASPPPRAESETACRSEYYAVFRTGTEPACARNPTNLMANWGPPSAGWFRTFGGEFRVTSDAISSVGRCACLATQPSYDEAKARNGTAPMDRILFDGRSVSIDKWVCADACNFHKRKNRHES